VGRSRLADAGVKYLFGNPGTTELPLSDALVDFTRIKYILGLQEVPVMAMADGFAQASRSPGVVNVHISCGLGNAMGMLYNAYRAGTPLILTAGQQDSRLKFGEPILWSDMVPVARPWTKWAVEVERAADVDGCQQDHDGQRDVAREQQVHHDRGQRRNEDQHRCHDQHREDQRTRARNRAAQTDFGLRSHDRFRL